MNGCWFAAAAVGDKARMFGVTWFRENPDAGRAIKRGVPGWGGVVNPSLGWVTAQAGAPGGAAIARRGGRGKVKAASLQVIPGKENKLRYHEKSLLPYE